MENGEDPHLVRAITQLSACRNALKDTTGSIRAMLDAVMVASQCTNKQDALTAWNNGHDEVNQHKELVAGLIEETTDFMYKGDFMVLDGDKKADYWDTLQATERDLNKINSQLIFYRLLSHIEHTEQMIGFLWKHLKDHRDKVFLRQVNGTLAERGLSLHKKQLANARNRLRYEIGNIMKLIERAMNNSHFSTITKQKQNEYYAKWKAYANQLSEIDMD